MTSREDHPGAGTLFVHGKTSNPAPISWEEIVKTREEPYIINTPDVLLERGIGEYTFIPGPEGVLGQGKFSVVYKVTGPDGQSYALKHTPLYPHHPLIAARLLREPTLLAQLPPHPNLIGVHGIKRTQGHFYLIEQYASSHVPLPAHPLPLSPSRAAYILDQLVSVIRDCLHTSRVCHRDLKGENILIDLESGDLLILDLGLATQFSASEPKLTTCCGSPAFHSPEIVNALAHPPGAITYYGPELDIWCIALTLLSLLLRIRFPLGPHHTHYSVMRSRTRDRLQELDDIYPPATPWLNIPSHDRLSAAQKSHEADEWRRVRKALKGFMEIDGKRRMQAFEAYEIGSQQAGRLEEFGNCLHAHGGRALKSTSFIPTEVEYTLPLYLNLDPQIDIPESEDQDQDRDSDKDELAISITSKEAIVLDNPTGMKERKVFSYIRYLLRSAGIGYHCFPPTEGDDTIYQLVLPLPKTGSSLSAIPPRNGTTSGRTPSTTRQGVGHGGSNGRQQSPTSKQNANGKGSGWVASLNPFKRPQPTRSTSLPASRARTKPGGVVDTLGIDKKGKDRYLKMWIKIEFDTPSSPSSSTTSPSIGYQHFLTPLIMSHGLPVPDLSFTSPTSPTSGPATAIAPSQTQTQSRPQSLRQPSPRRRTTSDRYSTSRPSPLSRQVSLDRRSLTPSRISGNGNEQNNQNHKRGRRRVIIHLSDERGHDVLVTALDIKHTEIEGIGNEDRPRSDVHGPNAVGVLIQGSRLRDDGHGERERERGRPRSKESVEQSVIHTSKADYNIVNTDKQHGQVGVQVVMDSESDGEGKSTATNRKSGGLWGLFTSPSTSTSSDSSESVSSRSVSVPPARQAAL